MKLLFRVQPRNGLGPLRVLVVFRQTACFPVAPPTAVTAARGYLEVVFSDGQTRTFYADSSRSTGFGSLAAARGRVANGEVEVVITTDLSRISPCGQVTADLVSHCVRHKTRLISFGDSFDFVDEGWQEELANRLTALVLKMTQGCV